MRAPHPVAALCEGAVGLSPRVSAPSTLGDHDAFLSATTSAGYTAAGSMCGQDILPVILAAILLTALFSPLVFLGRSLRGALGNGAMGIGQATQDMPLKAVVADVCAQRSVLIRKKMPGPRYTRVPDSRSCTSRAGYVQRLQHPEHDGADERERSICCDDVELRDEVHGKCSRFLRNASVALPRGQATGTETAEK